MTNNTLQVLSTPEPSMTYEQWIETYRPIKNPVTDEHGHDGLMYETYGEEVELVKLAPPECIWTIVTEGDFTTLTNGWHYVNREGYFITEVPFEGEFLEITLHEPRFQAEFWQGSAYVVKDVEAGSVVCFVDLEQVNGMEIAETIASALVEFDKEEGISLDYEREDDND